jgi:type I restriction enzyme S subunit
MIVKSKQHQTTAETEPPKDWRRVSLRSVAEVRFSNVDKKTSPGELPVRLCNYMDVYANDYIVSGMPFMHASATKSEIARFRLQQGDVIITKDSETPDDIGISAVVDDAAGNVVCGYHLALIRPQLDEVDPTFLAKQLGHPTTARFFGQRATGSTRYGLANSTVENTPVLLPSLKAQKAVGSVVRQVDQAIEQAEALIAKHQRIKTGLTQDLLTRGIDEHGRLRDPATHRFKPSLVGSIPIDWQVAAIGSEDVSSSITSGSRGWAKFYSEEGALFLRISNLTRKHINLRWDDLKFVRPASGAEGQRTSARCGDLLISITADLGIIGVVPQGMGEAYVNQHIALVRLNREKVNPWFLGNWLASHTGQRWFSRMNEAGAKAGLNLPTVGAMPVVLPTLEEQVAIAKVLTRADEGLVCHEEMLSKLQRLKTGLMQDLLTGKVSVEPLLNLQTAN